MPRCLNMADSYRVPLIWLLKDAGADLFVSMVLEMVLINVPSLLT